MALSHRKPASGKTDKQCGSKEKPHGSNPCGNQNLFIQFIGFIQESKQASKQATSKQASKKIQASKQKKYKQANKQTSKKNTSKQAKKYKQTSKQAR